MSTFQNEIDRLCGDYPAPCNCDDPATHDGAVEAAAEIDSAANWRSALEDNEGHFDESELPWYGDGSPRYRGHPTPAQIEAARRFVSHWLESDSHGFVIPGSEWGRSLKHWLTMLVATPAPGGQDLPSTDRPESPGSNFPDRSRPLIEQVRDRIMGPIQWISFLQYDHSWLQPPLDPDEITEALAEAKRMRAADEAETAKMLGRQI